MQGHEHVSPCSWERFIPEDIHFLADAFQDTTHAVFRDSARNMASMMNVPSSGWRGSPEHCHDTGRHHNPRGHHSRRSFSGSPPDHRSNREAHIHNWNSNPQSQPHPHPHQHPHHMHVHPRQNRGPHHGDRESGHSYATANPGVACAYTFTPHSAEETHWEHPAPDYPPVWFSPQKRHHAPPSHHHIEPHNHHHHEYHPHTHFTAASAAAAGIAARTSHGGPNLDWAASAFTMPPTRPTPGLFHMGAPHPRGYSPPPPTHAPHQTYNTSAWADHMAAHAASMATHAASVAAAVAAATSSTAAAAVAAAAAAGLSTAASAFSSAAAAPLYRGPDWPPTASSAAAAAAATAATATATAQQTLRFCGTDSADIAVPAMDEDAGVAKDAKEAALLIQRVWRGARLSRHRSAISTLAFIQSSAQEAMLWLKRVCADGAALVEAGEGGVQAWLRSLYPKKMAEVDEIATSGFLELDRLCGLPWELKAIRRELARQLLSLQDTLADDNGMACANPSPDPHQPTSVNNSVAYSCAFPTLASPILNSLNYGSYCRIPDPARSNVASTTPSHTPPPPPILPLPVVTSPLSLSTLRPVAVAGPANGLGNASADSMCGPEFGPMLPSYYQAHGLFDGRSRSDWADAESRAASHAGLEVFNLNLPGKMNSLPGFGSGGGLPARLTPEHICIDLTHSDTDDEDSVSQQGSSLSHSGGDSFYASLLSTIAASAPGLAAAGSGEVCVRLGSSNIAGAVDVEREDEALVVPEDADPFQELRFECGGDHDETIRIYLHKVDAEAAAAAAAVAAAAAAAAATHPTPLSRTSSGWSLVVPEEEEEEDEEADDDEDDVTESSEEDEESVNAEENVESCRSSGSGGFDWELGALTTSPPRTLSHTELQQQLQAEDVNYGDVGCDEDEDGNGSEDLEIWKDVDVWALNGVAPAPPLSAYLELHEAETVQDLLKLSELQTQAHRFEETEQEMRSAGPSVTLTSDERERALLDRVAILEAQVQGLILMVARQGGWDARTH